MVKQVILCAALVLCAGAAHAADADWLGAGGPLFVGQAPVVGQAAAKDPAARDRVPTDEGYDLRLTPLHQPYGAEITAAAERFGLDPKLLHAVVAVESAYRAKAVSAVGAAGLTQLMPATAAQVGVLDRFDPAENVFGGAAYLALLLRRFGDLRLALAAFNAGPGRVTALGHVLDIAETRAYVASVIDCYLALSAGRSIRSVKDCHANTMQ